jgi:integrase
MKAEQLQIDSPAPAQIIPIAAATEKTGKIRIRLFQKILDRLPRPASGSKLYWGKDEVRGFAVRVTACGTVAFILNYRFQRRQRRYTLGQHPTMTLAEARTEAHDLYAGIQKGRDPLAARRSSRQLERSAQTMTDLAREYFERYAEKNKRASSLRNDRQMLDVLVLPKLGHLTVASVTKRNIESLHASLRATPYRANRVLALLSKMFALAVEWHADDPIWRTDNPAAHIKHFHEEKRERWLDAEELGRLNVALDAAKNQESANAIRLLMLTGARKNEVLSATWPQIDLKRRIWTKPSAHTKQKKEHIVAISEAALEILDKMKRAAGDDDAGFLFPGRKSGDHQHDLKQEWKGLCREAKLSGVRIHDLRHTYASHLISDGVPLAVIGKLLGHTQSQTTERYAHVANEVQRDATNRFGKMIARR